MFTFNTNILKGINPFFCAVESTPFTPKLKRVLIVFKINLFYILSLQTAVKRVLLKRFYLK